MDVGKRIFYNKTTGKVLNDTLEGRSDTGLTQDSVSEIRPDLSNINFIDLPYNYNDNNFLDALTYHIDVTKDKTITTIKNLIIIDTSNPHIPTYEELQQQILQLQGVI